MLQKVTDSMDKSNPRNSHKNVSSEPLYKTREGALAAPGDIYLHYKGGIYRVLHTNVTHTETSESGVVYEHLYPHTYGCYFRPTEMFFGILKNGSRRFIPVKTFRKRI